MRERKYIKLRSDMYEDTKFKIIDTMENRDTINYIWTRILALCGKINNSLGYLLVSKNMIYTTELLAIEFNRSIEQVEDAISVFIDLNMMNRDENGTLIVCNWGKHQGYVKKNKEDIKLEVKENKKEETGKANLEIVKNTNRKDMISENNINVIKIQDKSKEINNKRENNNIVDISENKSKNNNLNLDSNRKSKTNKKKIKRKKEETISIDSDIIEEDICGCVEGDTSNFGRVIKTFDMS